MRRADPPSNRFCGLCVGSRDLKNGQYPKKGSKKSLIIIIIIISHYRAGLWTDFWTMNWEGFGLKCVLYKALCQHATGRAGKTFYRDELHVRRFDL
jgi:hypothetical protein